MLYNKDRKYSVEPKLSENKIELTFYNDGGKHGAHERLDHYEFTPLKLLKTLQEVEEMGCRIDDLEEEVDSLENEICIINNVDNMDDSELLMELNKRINGNNKLTMNEHDFIMEQIKSI